MEGGMGGWLDGWREGGWEMVQRKLWQVEDQKGDIERESKTLPSQITGLERDVWTWRDGLVGGCMDGGRVGGLEGWMRWDGWRD